MNTKRIQELLLGVGAMVLLLAACDLSLSTSAPLATPTPSLTSPASTTTPTFTPTIVPTTTRTPTHTPTLAPTLSAKAREDYIEELLKTNAGCELPCWWEITPGETTWKETERFFLSLGARIANTADPSGIVFHGIGGLDFATRSIYNGISFRERDGVVESIWVDADGLYNTPDFKTIWERYAPEQVISTYGQPTRVWVQSISAVLEGSPGNTVPYDLWLFYDELGFLIRYEGSVVYKPIYQICPTFGKNGNIGTGMQIYLQAPVGKTPLEELVGEKAGSKASIHSIEEAASLSVKEFSALYAQSEVPICFETPRDIWP